MAVTLRIGTTCSTSMACSAPPPRAGGARVELLGGLALPRFNADRDALGAQELS
jgi:hypothetical protein